MTSENQKEIWIRNTVFYFSVGAFYPYSRNHNGIDWRDQHPPALGENVVESARRSLLIRYKFLASLYTFMFESHFFGSTTVRHGLKMIFEPAIESIRQILNDKKFFL